MKDELGRRLVARFHDERASVAASEEFARVFSAKQVPDDIRTVTVPPADLKDGRSGIVALLVHANLASSNSEARRLVQQGAVEIDGQRINDPKAEVEVHKGAVIRCGKRGFVRIAS